MSPRIRQKVSSKVSWTDEDRVKLLETYRPGISWTEYHKRNLFPGRSQIATYREWRNLNQPGSIKGQQIKSMMKTTSKITVLKTGKRRLEPEQGDTEMRQPHKQPRQDDDGDEDEESDDNGDIEPNGQTRPMHVQQAMYRRTQDLRNSPPKNQTPNQRLPAREHLRSAPPVAKQPATLTHALPNRPVLDQPSVVAIDSPFSRRTPTSVATEKFVEPPESQNNTPQPVPLPRQGSPTRGVPAATTNTQGENMIDKGPTRTSTRSNRTPQPAQALLRHVSPIIKAQPATTSTQGETTNPNKKCTHTSRSDTLARHESPTMMAQSATRNTQDEPISHHEKRTWTSPSDSSTPQPTRLSPHPKPPTNTTPPAGTTNQKAPTNNSQTPPITSTKTPDESLSKPAPPLQPSGSISPAPKASPQPKPDQKQSTRSPPTPKPLPKPSTPCRKSFTQYLSTVVQLDTEYQETISELRSTITALERQIVNLQTSGSEQLCAFKKQIAELLVERENDRRQMEREREEWENYRRGMASEREEREKDRERMRKMEGYIKRFEMVFGAQVGGDGNVEGMAA
ncbi:hypothetical protein BDV12DRAFT_201513 [Aspergillus spectabilis]